MSCVCVCSLMIILPFAGVNRPIVSHRNQQKPTGSSNQSHRPGDGEDADAEHYHGVMNCPSGEKADGGSINGDTPKSSIRWDFPL